MDSSIIDNELPLQTDYVPADFQGRDQEVKTVETAIQAAKTGTGENIVLHGPHGTGKTHLTRHLLRDRPKETLLCYIPCLRYRTQYQTLQRLHRVITGDSIGTGHHTSDLQREIKEQISHVNAIIVLDDIEFLLSNDGDDFLYYLSRLNSEGTLSLILLTSNHTSLEDQLAERTYSSLHPRRIPFEPYSAEALYRLLKQRAEKSLKPRTLHTEALSYIAASTQNATQAIHWLKTAAEHADQTITEETVADATDQAFQNYADHLLKPFTDHHQHLLQAVQELTRDNGSVNTGKVYEHYQDLSQTHSENQLSNRRISTYLKHLEHLQLIQSQYHYGGQKGKTREIKLNMV